MFSRRHDEGVSVPGVSGIVVLRRGCGCLPVESFVQRQIFTLFPVEIRKRGSFAGRPQGLRYRFARLSLAVAVTSESLPAESHLGFSVSVSLPLLQLLGLSLPLSLSISGSVPPLVSMTLSLRLFI